MLIVTRGLKKVMLVESVKAVLKAVPSAVAPTVMKKLDKDNLQNTVLKIHWMLVKCLQ